MARVYNKRRVQRTTFRKLPKGAPYWASSDLTAAVQIKTGNLTALTGWNTTTGAKTTSAVAGNVACVRTPGQFVGQRGSRS